MNGLLQRNRQTYEALGSSPLILKGQQMEINTLDKLLLREHSGSKILVASPGKVCLWLTFHGHCGSVGRVSTCGDPSWGRLPRWKHVASEGAGAKGEREEVAEPAGDPGRFCSCHRARSSTCVGVPGGRGVCGPLSHAHHCDGKPPLEKV